MKGRALKGILPLYCDYNFLSILNNMKINKGDGSKGNLSSRRDFFKTTGQVVAASAITGGGIPYIDTERKKESLDVSADRSDGARGVGVVGRDRARRRSALPCHGGPGAERRSQDG